MLTPTHCHIDSAALVHNLQQVKQLAPQSNILAMIKANGYGHGLLTVAKALGAADGFGVACLSEAQTLRQAGVANRIVLMSGFLTAEQLQLCSQLKLDVVVHQAEQIALLQRAQLSEPVAVWLKVDTGMHRLGVNPGAVSDYYQQFIDCSNVVGQPILMSHFACAEQIDHTLNLEQLRCFDDLATTIAAPQSLCNSAALLNKLDQPRDWVRPGLMLYGVSPVPGKTGADFGLRPAMTLESSVVAMHNIAAGEGIGYGLAWRAPKAARIAIVNCGYGDGYPYLAANQAMVAMNDTYAPVVGHIAMDMLAVDITGISDVSLGQRVQLWGAHYPVEKLAAAAKTIPYELLCQVNER